MYMNLFDSHVHSDNSHDGEHSITFLCENAEQKNLMGLCITDHYELDQNLAQADLCLRNSFMETGKARQAFDYRLLVMNGIEMGQAIQNKEKAQEILRRYYDEARGTGFDYAYRFPGMNKVLQAAGRVIRTQEDRGVVLLLDDRFARAEYTRLFPRHWHQLQYLRSTTELEQQLAAFWARNQ